MRKYLLIGLCCCFILCIDVNKSFAQVVSAPKTDSGRGPQTYAMIMGISTYKYIRPLTYADKDAEMFRDYLKSPAGGKVPGDNIYCLLNEQAMAANFWVKGMAWLKQKNLQKGDRLYFYLAGHGDAINQDEFFFLTYDCNPAGDKNNYIVTGNVQLYLLKSRIGEFSRRGVEVFFIMDACRTNELPGGDEGQQALNAAISEKRAGEIIMLATGAGQESLEDASIGNGHGLFTYYLVDGLNGMADSQESPDNIISLDEIQKYVSKNVPTIAQEKFKRKQEPFICCPDEVIKPIGTVDTAYLRKWIQSKSLRPAGGSSVNPRSRGLNYPDDTLLIETYNKFNNAVKESRLTGENSAEFFYNLLVKSYPGTSYTIDAQSTLAVEFINFAQSKINLYLECRDAASIQKLRAQMDEEEKTEEINSTLDRMEKVARQEFSEVGSMLEKAISYIEPDDPSFARSLKGRMYFFKARAFYGKDRRFIDINKALQFAYNAYAADRSAAYVLNTLASLHFDNHRTDSAIYYAKRAINAAPQWRYPYVTLAYAYRNIGRVDSALKYYKASVQLDPNNADAFVDLGHYFYSLSKADSAIAYYQQALRLEPNNVYASNNIGWLNYERKDFNEATKYFRRSIQADPKFISAYNGISKAFVSQQQYDSARVYFSRAFANYSDKSAVNIYIGNFYKDLKLYDSAQSYYRSAINIDPSNEEGYNYLGKLFFDTKKLDSANALYKQALVLNPYSTYSLINLGLVFRELKNRDSSGYYFRQAIFYEPMNAALLNNLGVIYSKDNDFDSAKVYFKRALQVKADYKAAYNNLMKVYRELGEVDSITNYLKSLPHFNPNNISILNDLGLIFLEQKRFDSARFYYRRAIKTDPNNSQLYNNMAMVMNQLKMPDSARIYLQRSLQIDPDNMSAIINLANHFKNRGQYDSAGFYYRRQLTRRPIEDDQLFQSMGIFYLDMKAFDSSIVYFKKVIGINPNHVSSHVNVGSAYMSKEQPDSAFAYYRKATQLKPDHINANLNLGLLFHSLKRYDSAIVYLQKAITLNPKNGKAYFNLACSYALNNQPADAITALKNAYEKGYRNYNAMLEDPDLTSLLGNKEFEALLDKYIKNWRDR